jgi:D-alanyl-D-alanine carboxypeptidase
VSSRVIIRPAVKDDLEAISRLRNEAILGSRQRAYSREQLLQWARVQPGDRTLNRVSDACVLVGVSGKQIIACNSLDLDEKEMVGLFVHPTYQDQDLGSRMVREVERLATQFGILDLRAEAAEPAIGFYRKCKYRPRSGAGIQIDFRTGLNSLSMTRSFPHRQTRFGARVHRLLSQTGIPLDYGRIHRIKLQPEARELATIGNDIHGREQQLHPDSAMAWYALRNTASEDNIDLQVVSAFRSVGYQVSIIERKRKAGQSTRKILSVSAAPGYSEHHSGRAIDINSGDSKPLEECFENTSAFEWLTGNAEDFGFSLSYPRNNRHGIAYEPWHWYHQPGK